MVPEYLNNDVVVGDSDVVFCIVESSVFLKLATTIQHLGPHIIYQVKKGMREKTVAEQLKRDIVNSGRFGLAKVHIVLVYDNVDYPHYTKEVEQVLGRSVDVSIM